MDILIISHTRGQTWKMRLMPRSPWFIVPAIVLPLLVLSSVLWFGYELAPDERGVDQVLQATEVWDEDINAQRKEIADLRRNLDDNVHALAQRLGKLQAHVTRLNAVGSRMTHMAKLDAAEFDFANDPPIGGPETKDDEPAPTVDEFRTALDNFSRELDGRERQMRVLRDLMVAGELRDEVTPSGHPLKNGWITSNYGIRTDPFTGRRTSHNGVDFTSGLGADVIAVASGVVNYAGSRNGYGTLLELNHGNGYMTRYGHNKKLLVKEGERVEKGQIVAKMGATGRATGPHVHFEVLQNGRIVNPTAYIRASN